MRSNFEHDVFLSYSAKDKAVVRALAERLRTDGIKVWFDEWMLRPGDSIPAKIEEGLEHSRVLVLGMSAHAFGSDWAQLESGTFRFRDPLNKQRRFLPLRLDDAPIRGSLAQFLYIDWRSSESRERGYDKLLQACRSLSAEPTAVTLVKREDVRPGSEQVTGDIFQVGAPVPPTSPCYVRRKADIWLERFTSREREAAVIWGPRMIGKTSMILRLNAQLRELGRKCVMIDLQGVGTRSFHSLLGAIAWRISEALGDKILAQSAPKIGASADLASSRFFRFLEQISTPTLIVFDEVDGLRTSGFSNDFFGILRAAYSPETALSILISSFFPARYLQEDPNQSPFNIGAALKLSNFTRVEAETLLKLGNPKVNSDEVESLFRFTGGHPFLVHAAARLLWLGTPASDVCKSASERDDFISIFVELAGAQLSRDSKLKKAAQTFAAGKSLDEEALRDLVQYGFLSEEADGTPFMSGLHRMVVGR